MVARITVDEFFDALKAQKRYPHLDSSTPRVREIVAGNVRALCAHYPIEDRWPVLDLENAYEGYLNAQDNIIELHRHGYNGTLHVSGFDRTYDMSEWFGDFRVAWKLKDTDVVRRKMLELLPAGNKWLSPDLYKAHQDAVVATRKGFLAWLFG